MTMTDDIVAELDRWLAETVNEIYGPTPAMVRRARDEIVALRNTRAEAWAQGFEAAKGVVIAMNAMADRRATWPPPAQPGGAVMSDESSALAWRICYEDWSLGEIAARIDAYAARKVAEERKRCAQIADNGATLVENRDIKFTSPARMAADLARDIADAIRNHGNAEPSRKRITAAEDVAKGRAIPHSAKEPS
jgi:hypothetical protein